MDDYLRGLAPFDPNGSLSNADADRIWASYKAAGGGRDVSGTLPGAKRMDIGGFGAMGGGGGLLEMLKAKLGGGAAPAVPADGSMPATIGPGSPAPAPAAPAYAPKVGLPKGGLLGLMQGGSPQGLMGLLQQLSKPGAPAPGGAPLAGSMPQAGMLPGMPGSPLAGPVAPPAPQLPMDINPMNQF